MGLRPKARNGALADLRLLSVLITVALGVPSVASAATKPSHATKPTGKPRPFPCARANALLTAGYASDAEAAYKALLGTAACARAGVKAAVAFEQAKTQTGTTDPCVVGQALESAGRDDEALIVYLAALHRQPTLTCAASGAKRLQRGSVQHRSQALLKTVASWLGALAAAIALVLLVGYVVAAIFGRLPGLRSLPLVRQVRAPSLQVQPLDDSATTEPKMGSAIGVLLRGQIAGPRPFRDDLTRVTGQASIASAIGGLSNLSPQLQAFASVIAVLDRFLPRRTLLVEGVLQPDGSAPVAATAGQSGGVITPSPAPTDGPGISLSLKLNNHVRGEVTQWAGTFDYSHDVPQAWRQLVIPLAAWADHRMALCLGSKRLVTRDSVSYAFLQAGLSTEATDETLAKRHYHQALERDPGNVGALVAVALLEARQDNDHAAEQRLLQARARLETLDL